MARLAESPTIDGKLDDRAWHDATVIADFHQTYPGDNIAPSYPTRVMLGHDEKVLYVAVHALDRRDAIRATLANRDAVTKDDYVAIYLDTFHDRRTAYVLMFNPLGIQQDGTFAEGAGVDYSIDLLMQSRGIITDDGYTLEVALPFSSLKYDAGNDKHWGIHVLRYIKALDEENSWMPLRRDKATATDVRHQFLSQAGRLTGLHEIATERTLEIIPALTISESGARTRPSAETDTTPNDASPWQDDDAKVTSGLTMKWRMTPGLTLDAALNPDFGEVEADQLLVTANQRYPLFFAEKRPFFVEGMDLFQTPIQVLHTRAIVDPDVATKLSGKRGRTSLGLMLASDAGPGNFSDEEMSDPALRPSIEKLSGKNAHVGVLRLRRDVGSLSSVGLVAASREFVEERNRLAGVDGRFSMSRNTVLTLQLVGTTSRRSFYDPDRNQSLFRTGNGLGYYAEIGKTGQHLSMQLSGTGYTRDYRADVGFTQRTDMNRWSVVTRYDSEPRPDSNFISWSILYTYLMQIDWDERPQYGYHYPRLLLNFKRQTFLNLYLYRDYMHLYEEEFGARRNATQSGAFYGAAERSTVYKGFQIEAGTAPTRTYSFRVSLDAAWDYFDFDYGSGPKFPRVSPAALADPGAPLDPGPGRTMDIAASAAFVPTDALRLSLDYTRSRLVRNDTGLVAFDQNLYSVRTHYSFTRFAFVRARIDYDTMIANVRGQLLLGWTPNPGTAIYLGYNDDWAYDGFDPFSERHELGWRQNRRTFFLKMSYLIHHGF